MEFPLLFALSSFIGMWLAVKIGLLIRTRLRPPAKDEREDFGMIEGATLTLLGLIIGFSFSMATSRYDQRKNDEATEASAIGTEFFYADFLPPNHAARVRELLKKYADLRIAFYETRDRAQLALVDRETSEVQTEMWSVVRADAAAQPTSVTALVVAGMNDVSSSQGYTQAAWSNRIPAEAWLLMVFVAVFDSLLLGYGSHSARALVSLVLPLVVSVTFFLISDLDSPRRGLIHTYPQNLVSLSKSLNVERFSK